MNPNWTPEQQALYSTYDAAVQDIVDFSGKKIPSMGNKGAPEIVDMAGRQNALRKGSEKLEELLKNVVTARLESKTELRGDQYQITVAPTETTRLNQTKAKEILEKLDGYMHSLRLAVEAEDQNVICHIAAQMVKELTGELHCMESSSGARRTFSKLAPPAQ